MVESRESDQDGGEARTLVLRVESRGDFFDRVGDAMDALDAGGEPSSHGVSVASVEELERIASPTKLALIRAVANEAPASKRATARLVDRDIRQVSDDLDALEALGIIRYERHGNRLAPRCPYDAIDVRIPIRAGE